MVNLYDSREKVRFKNVNVTVTEDEILWAFHKRRGNCIHVYNRHFWGVTFDADEHHVLVYSGPYIGIQCQVDGGATHDLLGSGQFFGTTSRSVYDWLKRMSRERYGERAATAVNRKTEPKEER